MSFYTPFEDPSVMIFKESFDSQEKLYTFSRFFGDFDIDPVSKYSDEKPWLMCLANQSAEKFIGNGKGNDRIGGYWHLDYGFLLNPAKYTILRCVMIPPDGDDTAFLDLMSAYKDLPEEFKIKIETLWAVRDGGVITNKDVAHPLVMTNPIFTENYIV